MRLLNTEMKDYVCSGVCRLQGQVNSLLQEQHWVSEGYLKTLQHYLLESAQNLWTRNDYFYA